MKRKQFGTIIELPPNKFGEYAGLARFKAQWRKRGRQGSRVFYNRQDAKDYLADIKAGAVRATQRKRTVAELSEQFLTKRCANRISAGTFRDYSQLARNHVVPTIGNMKVADVTFEDIEYCLNQVMTRTVKGRSRPAGPRTANKVRTLLSGMFKYGQKLRWTNHNPARQTDKLPVDQREGVALTESEVQRLLAHTEAPYSEPIMMAVYSGMRQGEIMGLQWQDISFPERVIRIERQFTDGTLSKPKTKAGRRTVPISKPVEQMLRQLVAKRGGVRPTDWLFPDGDMPIHGNRVLRSGLRPALKRAGLPVTIRFHDLRHTAATAMARSGADVNTVQGMLGHATPLMALNVYTHVQEEAKRVAVERLADYLGADLNPKKLGSVS